MYGIEYRAGDRSFLRPGLAGGNKAWKETMTRKTAGDRYTQTGRTATTTIKPTRGRERAGPTPEAGKAVAAWTRLPQRTSRQDCRLAEGRAAIGRRRLVRRGPLRDRERERCRERERPGLERQGRRTGPRLERPGLACRDRHRVRCLERQGRECQGRRMGPCRVRRDQAPDRDPGQGGQATERVCLPERGPMPPTMRAKAAGVRPHRCAGANPVWCYGLFSSR